LTFPRVSSVPGRVFQAAEVEKREPHGIRLDHVSHAGNADLSHGRACLRSTSSCRRPRREPRPPRRSRAFPRETTEHPALIPQKVAGASRRRPPNPARRRLKALLAPIIPADPRPDRRDQDRPVTPEVAGSSPVAPVEKVLQIGLLLSILGQTIAGFAPASRTDPARQSSREPHAKSAANGPFLPPGWALSESLGLGHPAQIPRAHNRPGIHGFPSSGLLPGRGVVGAVHCATCSPSMRRPVAAGARRPTFVR
jgi:hypothetical protein